jgi:hypothetical protein
MRMRLGMRLALVVGLACVACGALTGDDGGGAGDLPDRASLDATAPDAAGVGDAGCTTCADLIAKKITAPEAIAVVAGTLWFADGTKDVFTCDPTACTPKPSFQGSQLKVKLAASTGGAVALDTTCSAVPRNDGVYLYDATGTPARIVGDPCPTAVAAAEAFLFYTSAGDLNHATTYSVNRCDTGGCGAVAGGSFVDGYGAPRALAATASDVFMGSSNGHLLRWPNKTNAGSPEVLLASGETFLELATDGATLAWIDGASVRSCPVATCKDNVVTVAPDTTARHVVVDAKGVYWTSEGSGGTDGKVLRRGANDATPVAVVTGQLSPNAIDVRDGWIYWSTRGCDGCNAGQGAIFRRPEP